jgi:hypothetical protein
MVYVKWFLISSVWLLVFAFVHYTLPQQDIARVVGVENRRIDFGENSIFWAGPDTGQLATTQNRDVRFINAVRKKTYLLGLVRGADEVMVYRNEDTGVGWPPYFKLDSSNLQTDAEDAKSTREDPRWYVITHYGWRNEWFSIFPNAVGIRPIDDPNKFLIPWINIFLLIVMAGLSLGIFRMLQWFKRSKIDPITESVGETWDAVDDYADEQSSGFRAWLDSWKGKPRK